MSEASEEDMAKAIQRVLHPASLADLDQVQKQVDNSREMLIALHAVVEVMSQLIVGYGITTSEEIVELATQLKTNLMNEARKRQDQGSQETT